MVAIRFNVYFIHFPTPYLWHKATYTKSKKLDFNLAGGGGSSDARQASLSSCNIEIVRHGPNCVRAGTHKRGFLGARDLICRVAVGDGLPGEFWLGDEQWERLQSLLPNKPRGVPRVDDCRVINGIVRVPQAGGRWKEASSPYGPYKTP